MFFLIILCVISEALSVAVPFIMPCKIDDNQCIIKAANGAIPFFLPGIPELGIPSLDPLRIKEIKNDDSGLKMTFSDNYIKGLKTCVISNFKSEILAKNLHTLTIKCSNILMEGHYKVDGQLIILPVRGEGKASIDMYDVVVKIFATITNVTGGDGQPHWHIDEWRHTFKVLTKATFKLENLFEGNKILAEPVAEFLNTNWKDVLQETGKPVVEAIVSKFIDVTEVLYKYAAINEITLP